MSGPLFFQPPPLPPNADGGLSMKDAEAKYQQRLRTQQRLMGLGPKTGEEDAKSTTSTDKKGPVMSYDDDVSTTASTADRKSHRSSHGIGDKVSGAMSKLKDVFKEK
ncbi:MAG: hypothetical protein M1819_001972 [Sarea resinae]|nr:MAG: hypothetical protein M1819_001972 [Sarea resinae]